MIEHNSFNGKPQAMKNCHRTDAFGLPLNEKVMRGHLKKNAAR